MGKHVVIMCLACGCLGLFAEAQFKNDGFASADWGCYFQSLGRAVYERGRLTLPLGGVHQVRTLPFPVKSGERYRLAFRAQVIGPHVIENNQYYSWLFFHHDWSRRHLGQALSTWKVSFFDACQGIVMQAPNFRQFFTAMMSNRLRSYCEEFVVPPGARSLEVAFENATVVDALMIEALALDRIRSPDTLNVNPDFRLGEDNYSGWNSGGNRARLVADPEEPGDFQLQLFNTGVRSDAIYVKPGDVLRLDYRMRQTDDVDGGARMVVFTYASHLLRDDCQTGQLQRAFGFGRRQSEGSYVFVVPDGIAVLRIYLENVTADYVRLTKAEP